MAVFRFIGRCCNKVTFTFKPARTFLFSLSKKYYRLYLDVKFKIWSEIKVRTGRLQTKW